MNDERKTRDFIGYEYKDIIVDHNLESLYVDSYSNFGWILEKRSGITPGLSAISLKFKRDRKILNKAELTRLQRQLEACIREITILEKSKALSGTITSLIVGLIGCAFLALSVFAIIAETPNILLCIIFGLPGITGWILPYFIFKKLSIKRTQTVDPLINIKYDEIYDVCEKGNALLPK